MTAPALLGDGRALADILALAGPDMATRILAQMHADLAGVSARLTPAISADDHATPDWTEIRAQSHILIALAGTIGAPRLHALSVDLNGAAHAMDAPQLRAIAQPLQQDLASLIALLAARLPAPNGGAA